MLILVNFDYSCTYFTSIIEINIKIKKTIKDKIKTHVTYHSYF